MLHEDVSVDDPVQEIAESDFRCLLGIEIVIAVDLLPCDAVGDALVPWLMRGCFNRASFHLERELSRVHQLSHYERRHEDRSLDLHIPARTRPLISGYMPEPFV